MSSVKCLSSCTRLLANCTPATRNVRNFSRTNFLRAADDDLRKMIIPSNFEKFVLVMAKQYKNKEEVPDRVPIQKMKKSLDMFRGKATFVMMGVAVVLLYLAILSGKRLRDSGDSLQRRGLEQEHFWRENEKARLEYEAAKNAASASK